MIKAAKFGIAAWSRLSRCEWHLLMHLNDVLSSPSFRSFGVDKELSRFCASFPSCLFSNEYIYITYFHSFTTSLKKPRKFTSAEWCHRLNIATVLLVNYSYLIENYRFGYITLVQKDIRLILPEIFENILI